VIPAVVVVDVEEAPGPGVDFEVDAGVGLVGRRSRRGAAWLGFDRAALVDSDDGQGRGVPVLVALPASTFRGARLQVELRGGWHTERGVVLLARMPGDSDPLERLARVAARVETHAARLDATAANAEAHRARLRHRERRSRARIVGGRAWYAVDALPPELARFGTPHSLAEYSLRRLPQRFVRGLEGLLDDDERVLYWVERPIREAGVIERLRGVDRRAALLVLTDRQLLWIVDHSQPDPFMSDWGVDVELVPAERVRGTRVEGRGDLVELVISTTAGELVHRLPVELQGEVEVLERLLRRFTPSAAGHLPRRQYQLEPLPFDREPAARYGQEAEADRLYRAASAVGDPLAVLFSPRRESQREPMALVLRSSSVELVSEKKRHEIPLEDVRSVGLTLSPLVGRLEVRDHVALSYPSPLAEQAAAFVRLARRAMALTA
jgi:hypothetical protein